MTFPSNDPEVQKNGLMTMFNINMSFNKNYVFSMRWAAISRQKLVTVRPKRQRILWFCEERYGRLEHYCLIRSVRILLRSAFSVTYSGYVISVSFFLILFGLSDEAVSNSNYVALNGRMISKTEYCQGGLRKTGCSVSQTRFQPVACQTQVKHTSVWDNLVTPLYIRVHDSLSSKVYSELDYITY
jgi:hypothetical protein